MEMERIDNGDHSSTIANSNINLMSHAYRSVDWQSSTQHLLSMGSTIRTLKKEQE